MLKLVLLLQGSDYTCKFAQAIKSIQMEHKERFHILTYETPLLDCDGEQFADCLEQVKNADFVFINTHGGLAFFKGFLKIYEYVKDKKFFVLSGIDSENSELMKEMKLLPEEYARICQYFDAGGWGNYKQMLLYIASRICQQDVAYEAVSLPVWQGIYGLPEGMDEDCFIQSVDRHKGPVIGLIIHYSNIENKNTRHIDALVKAVERAGAKALPIFTSMVPDRRTKALGLKGSMEKYFMKGERCRIDALIVTCGFSLTILSNPGDGSQRVEASVFERLNVPVLQAMATYFNFEQWKDSLMGIDSMLLSSNVYQTEFDGQILSVPIAYTDLVETPYGMKTAAFPIPDRVEKAARLAVNWARLRYIPYEEKKVAVILHNMPPRNDMIGCAYGLDTPESVFNMVRALQKNGLSTEYDFTDGQEIIQKIIDGLTNDGRFLPPEGMLERSVDTVDKNLYKTWYEQFDAKIRSELTRDWGEAPGDFMSVHGKILIPGILNGNLFIGLQPPRALEEKAEEAYHSTDIVCPHQYLAFYKWVEKVFKADVIVHVGTHGTIEWLPGKEIGLSSACYPDAAIGEMPHLYPYIIDVPGEGVQAKRRTSACLLDYLIPSMKESGLYGELQELDDMIEQYYHARQGDKGKLPVIAGQIWEFACRQNLNLDLNLEKADFDQDVDTCIERMHVWVSEIKNSEIKDGLHIFGQVPEGERYDNMLRLLVRIRNGFIPSLREGMCAFYGMDDQEMIKHPEFVREDGKTNGMVLSHMDEKGKQIFEGLRNENYDPEKITEVIHNTLGQGNGETLERCLEYVCRILAPKLSQTTDEIRYFLKGIQGEFVIPGPSGCPSRGNAQLLPTGRNFYTIDPSCVPSRASWTTGKILGDQMIERFIKDTGKMPENVAIVVYSGETMKTYGDDISEIMYLYGIRPVWLGDSDRVMGLEVIPLEELGRPRIDVVLRISGLFRDTFPNLIERIEDAVNLVSSLDEPLDQNFVKKHISQDILQWKKEGLNHEQAFERASIRVFGCPPGTYGAGVDILVNSKKWETVEDLGEAYSNWGAHAYGTKIHGEKCTEIFARRLSDCDITIKNVSSVEADMLDSDDFYNYHGGLISAVKKHSGKMPKSYSTNGGDPQNIVTRDIHEETSRIMRARINNPQWIAGLKKHGFRGAQEISSMMDIVFGWDATSEVVDDWMYESITKTYLMDKEVKDWINDVNPWALHAISERLLEASQRGMWNAKEDTLNAVRDIYLEMEGSIEEIQ